MSIIIPDTYSGAPDECSRHWPQKPDECGCEWKLSLETCSRHETPFCNAELCRDERYDRYHEDAKTNPDRCDLCLFTSGHSQFCKRY